METLVRTGMRMTVQAETVVLLALALLLPLLLLVLLLLRLLSMVLHSLHLLPSAS